jgi:hypothetical protein
VYTVTNLGEAWLLHYFTLLLSFSQLFGARKLNTNEDSENMLGKILSKT